MKIELEFEPSEVQELFDNVASIVCKYECVQKMHKDKNKAYQELEEQRENSKLEVSRKDKNLHEQKVMYEKRIEEMREDHEAEMETLRKQIEELSKKQSSIKAKK